MQYARNNYMNVMVNESNKYIYKLNNCNKRIKNKMRNNTIARMVVTKFDSKYTHTVYVDTIKMYIQNTLTAKYLWI